MNSQPIIGITCRPMNDGLEVWMPSQQGAIQPMIDAVVRAGGAPLLIPLVDNAPTLRRLYEALDGVLLVGGGDVDPRLYGEEPKVALLNPDSLLDRVELPLAQWAVADQKPLLGICRGHQIINVALGGSLLQDVGLATGTTIEHNESWLEHEYDRLIHGVILTAHTRLVTMLGATQLEVNSLHHQAINQLGSGLEIVGVAPDGVVEAIEGTGEGFVLGMQSHPEHLAAHDSRWQGVFTAFVAAATSRLATNARL